MSKMYRVRPGRRHGAQKQYGPGDIVGPYTDAEAAGFLDKLEPVEAEAVNKAEVKSKPAKVADEAKEGAGK
jgi:hypothetical protein